MDVPTDAAGRPRPLSPHLQIYRPQLTSVLSVLHRATGVALSAGMGMLSLWLVALALGGGTWAVVTSFLESWVGLFFLMGWVWSLFFHLCTGVRHLVWDTGRGLDLPSVYRGGYLAVALSTFLTVATWAVAFLSRGG